MRFFTLFILLTCYLSVKSQNATPDWSLSGNSNASTSSKFGTTTNIPLRIFTNNLERMRIDAATGKVTIGSSFFRGKLTLFNNGTSPASSWITTSNPLFTGFGEASGGNSDFFLMMASNTVTTRPNIIGRRSRGTLATPLSVTNNDFITSLQGSGYDGYAFQNAANVDFFVDGTPAFGNVPMRIVFSTGSNISNRLERLKIGSTGDFIFNSGQLLLQQSTGFLGLGKSPVYNLDVLGKASFSDKILVGVDVNDVMNPGVEILSNNKGEGAFYIKNNDNTEYRAGFSVNGAGNAVVASYIQDKNIGFYTGGVYRMVLESNGNLGIGTTKPNHPLHVKAPSDLAAIKGENSYAGDADRIGIDGYSVNAPGYGIGVRGTGGWKGIEGSIDAGSFTGTVYGTTGMAFGTAGNRHGIYGTALNVLKNNTGNMYGVYGYADGGSFNAAGFFSGDVHAYSFLNISDRKFKSGIKPVKNALDGLMKLKPATYEFKKAEFQSMNLPDGLHIGLIADELKEVFPELVKESIHPAQYDKDGRKQISPEVKYEGVNYVELIPVLIASVQELKKENETQKQELLELKHLVNKLVSNQVTTTLNNAFLSAATPNPATSSAIISYNLPKGSRTAYIIVTDMKGSLLKRINTSGKYNGQVHLNTASLASGTYTYSLFVDEVKIETKQLLVTR